MRGPVGDAGPEEQGCHRAQVPQIHGMRGEQRQVGLALLPLRQQLGVVLLQRAGSQTCPCQRRAFRTVKAHVLLWLLLPLFTLTHSAAAPQCATNSRGPAPCKCCYLYSRFASSVSRLRCACSLTLSASACSWSGLTKVSGRHSHHRWWVHEPRQPGLPPLHPNQGCLLLSARCLATLCSHCSTSPWGAPSCSSSSSSSP